MQKHFRYSNTRFQLLESMGVSAAKVLRHAHLSQKLLTEHRFLLTTKEAFALGEAIAEVSGNPAIGLVLGTVTRTQSFNPPGIAALCSDTLGEAMAQVGRYKQLTCPEELVQHKSKGEWTLRFRFLMTDQPEPPVLIQAGFSYLLSIARHGTENKGFSPLRLELTDSNAPIKQIKQLFGCPVVTRAKHNVMVLRESDSELPFVTRNPELFEMLGPQLEQELNEGLNTESFVDRVRLAIQEKLTGRRPAMEDIADVLHVSPRTLQRRLHDDGYNFQRVLEEARRHLARHYLAHSHLDLNDAAFLLGYNDAGSFVRAFRAWEGVPPSRWRDEQRSSPVH
jgi:AraC-like DNA-binding protein